MVVSHPPAEWNNFRSESSRGQLLRDLIEIGKMDPVVARAQVDKDFAKRGRMRVKPPRPASPEPSVSQPSEEQLPVRPKPNARKTRRDPSPSSKRASSTVRPKSATTTSKRDPAPKSKPGREKSPHRGRANQPPRQKLLTTTPGKDDSRPKRHHSSRRDTGRRHSSTPKAPRSPSPSRPKNRNSSRQRGGDTRPPPRPRGRQRSPSPPVGIRSPSPRKGHQSRKHHPRDPSPPRRGRSLSPASRPATPDPEAEWRAMMEKEARGEIDEPSELDKELTRHEDHYVPLGYLRPRLGTPLWTRFALIDEWMVTFQPGYVANPEIVDRAGKENIDKYRRHADARPSSPDDRIIVLLEDDAARHGYRRPPLGTDIDARLAILDAWNDKQKRRDWQSDTDSDSSSRSRNSRRHRSPSPTMTYSPPPRKQRSPSPARRRHRSPSPKRGRSSSTSVRSTTPDADAQWRKDMEREAQGDVERSEWDKQMIAIEEYWARHGYRIPAPGKTIIERFRMVEDWLEYNPSIARQYGPGPNLDHLVDQMPPSKPPTAEALNKAREFEEEAAERGGYRIPPPGTDYKTRLRLLRDWVRNYNPGQQYGQGPSMGNSYGMGGPSGYQQHFPGPSMGNPYASSHPPGYAQFNSMTSDSDHDAEYRRATENSNRMQDMLLDTLKTYLTKQGYKLD